MKVSELITLLNKCDQKAIVMFDDLREIGYIDRSDITTVYEARCLDPDNRSFVILVNDEEGDE